jgi:DNA invertase Pin-like site-specific DNA recombinase
LIRERTQAGLAAARARGRKGGRPQAKGLNNPKKLALAQKLYDDPTNDIATICRTPGGGPLDPLSVITPHARATDATVS